MKKLLITLLALGLVSCEKTEQDYIDWTSKVEKLEKQYESTSAKLKRSNEVLTQVRQETAHLTKIKEGKTPVYILTLKSRQESISLDLMKHAKDGMNSAEFSIPVSKEFYDSQSVGDKLTDQFKMGSLVLGNSLGSIVIRVTDKRIEYND